MILACQKLLGQITKVLGFEETPPPRMGKTPKKSRIFFLRGSLIVRASKQLRASRSLHAPVLLSGGEKVPFGAFICRQNVETRDKCGIFGTIFP